ncbi:hypothetical protein FRB97_008378 [Tulasnella sp. 331]|nr:hypothetical protein FRB97_008378 [Tulasnella sp. 331]
MGALCPNLIDLRLATEEIGKDSIAIAAQTIGKLHHLRTVYLRSNVDDVTAIVSKIAELPALESLSLDCLVGFPSSWLPSPTPPFPQLKKLCVERPSNPGTTAFLHSLATTGSRLMELELGQEYYSQIKDPKEMMRLVGEHIGLESLVMYNKYNRAGIFFDTLRPILQCHSLTKMKLDMGGNMRLTDDDIETLASGLPKLEHIALLSRGFSPSSLLTLRALSIAVARWPYLETLSIIVDARNSVPREQHVHNTPHQHLAQLTVGNSPISDDANDVTSFIGGLSEVEGFRIQYDPFGRSGELWGAVSAALPAMRVKRVAEWSGLAADRG